MNISEITSLVVSFTALVISLRDLHKTTIDNKFRKYELNYKYKVECYSELLSLLLHQDLTGETNLDDYLLRLNKATTQAKMFCSEKTQSYIDNLISQLHSDRFIESGKLNEEFYNAFHKCVEAFRNELNY